MLDKAVEAAYAGAFWSAGQKCTATRRIYVQASVYEHFRERLLARIDRGKVGDPADPATEVGPIVNERQMDEVLAAIEQGRAEGGSVLAGGERADDEAYLVAPTVFEGVADDGLLSCEEVFGPVTSLYPFADARRGDRARQRASVRALGGDLHREPARGAALRRQVAGGHRPRQLADRRRRRPRPVRGHQGLGYGPHEQGRAAMEFYTEQVTVYQDP